MIDERDKRIFKLQEQISAFSTKLYETEQRCNDYREAFDFLKTEYNDLKEFLKIHHPNIISQYYHDKELKLSLEEDNKF